MGIIIETSAIDSIYEFYSYTATQFPNTYSLENMLANIDEVTSAAKYIESLYHRTPTIPKFVVHNYTEACYKRKGHSSYDWYFEFKIEKDGNNADVIHIYEALHKSQMHESFYYKLDRIITETLNRVIRENILAENRKKKVLR